MRLEFAGSPLLATSRAAVWRHLLDPRFIADCLPAVRSVEVLDATRFRVVSGFGVGLLKLEFTVLIELFDLVEPESARLRMHGSARGTTVDMQSHVRLEDAGRDRVRLHWAAASELHGAAAALGPLVEGAARRLTEMFWKEFARKAEAEAAGATR